MPINIPLITNWYISKVTTKNIIKLLLNFCQGLKIKRRKIVSRGLQNRLWEVHYGQKFISNNEKMVNIINKSGHLLSRSWCLAGGKNYNNKLIIMKRFSHLKWNKKIFFLCYLFFLDMLINGWVFTWGAYLQHRFWQAFDTLNNEYSYNQFSLLSTFYTWNVCVIMVT